MNTSPSPSRPDWRQRIAPDGDDPVVRSCRVSVLDLLRELGKAGVEEVLRRHPGLQDEDLRACFALAAEGLTANAAWLREATSVTQTVQVPPAGSAESATLPPADDLGRTTSPAPATDECPTRAPGPALASSAGRANIPGYEVLSELGRGGMGVVYKARHLKLNRIVALKMILAGEHAGAEMLSRFQNEAEAVARLQHPGIVQIYEVGEHDGHSFLALEFVAGGSLASRLTEKPWEGPEAAALVQKLARAVHTAHLKGIVHRDLKPENVLLTEDGEPKLTDFGLAKKLETTGQTRTGEVMGTPSYMAPEQAAGKKDVGPAADVHALGAILHRLLSGRPPFEGPTTLDVLMSVLADEARPLRRLERTVPRDLETITLKCLQKQPGRRYATAAELADDLRRYLDGEPIRARQVSAFTRMGRWTLQHSDLAAMRGTVLLILLVSTLAVASNGGVQGVSSGALFPILLATGMRGRGRPMFAGGLTTALAAVFLGASWQAIAAGQYAWLERVTAPLGLVPFLCLLPFPLAVLAGAVFRERVHTLLILAGLLGTGAILGFPTSIGGLLIGSAASCYIALVSRLVQRQWGGNLLDVACGALLGAIFGSFLGGCMGGLLGMQRAIVADPALARWGTYAFSASILFFGVAGTVLSAIRVAYMTRSRRSAA